jgi:hypothetical protein
MTETSDDLVKIDKKFYDDLKTDLEQMLPEKGLPEKRLPLGKMFKQTFMNRFPSDIGDDKLKSELEMIRAKLNPPKSAPGSDGTSRRSKKRKMRKMNTRKNRK